MNTLPPKSQQAPPRSQQPVLEFLAPNQKRQSGGAEPQDEDNASQETSEACIQFFIRETMPGHHLRKTPGRSSQLRERASGSINRNC
jgi:hypothetical protein